MWLRKSTCALFSVYIIYVHYICDSWKVTLDLFISNELEYFFKFRCLFFFSFAK